MAQPAGKRKRGNEDLGRHVKENKHTQPDDDYSLLQATVGMDTQRTAQDALEVPYPEANVFDGSLEAAFAGNSPPQSMNTPQHGMYGAPGAAPTPLGIAEEGKPNVGSPEWHKARKDSHKEVERRRREVINEGIDSIAKVVPGQEKNKGAILQRTLSYVLELQDKEKRFADERQVLQMAIDELTKRNEALRNSNRQAWADANKWQQRCRDLGGDYDDYDAHAPPFDETNDLDSNLQPS